MENIETTLESADVTVDKKKLFINLALMVGVPIVVGIAVSLIQKKLLDHSVQN